MVNRARTAPAAALNRPSGSGTATSLRRPALVALSLLATPVPLFVSTSATLYLTNQDELHRQVGVLFPFVAYFLGTWLIGCVLYGLSRFRPFAYLLCAYYLLGPFSLVYLFFHNLSVGIGLFGVFERFSFYTSLLTDSLLGPLLYAALFLAVLAWAAPRFRVEALAKPFAVFSLLLVVIEVVAFAGTYRAPEVSEEPRRISLTASKPASLPNVYHIILDGYQSDIFPLTFDADTEKNFEGFTFLRKATSLYGLTRDSLPTVFSGRDYPAGVSRETYQEAAFADERSMLFWLKEAGYDVIAFAPKTFPFEPKLYDQRLLHVSNSRPEELLRMDRAAFKRLWVFANAPMAITERLMTTDWFIQFGGAQDMKLIQNGRFLGYSRALASYLAFLNVLEQEKDLPPAGRYTFFHFLIPHPPYVLGEDCSYDRPGVQTGPVAQSACATRLAVAFIQRLKELRRFDDSLIVIHADHGDYFDVSGENLTPREEISLKALLLVKPIGSRSPFAVSDAPSSLLDVAPTILDATGIHHALPADGVSLLPLGGQSDSVSTASTASRR